MKLRTYTLYRVGHKLRAPSVQNVRTVCSLGDIRRHKSMISELEEEVDGIRHGWQCSTRDGTGIRTTMSYCEFCLPGRNEDSGLSRTGLDYDLRYSTGHSALTITLLRITIEPELLEQRSHRNHYIVPLPWILWATGLTYGTCHSVGPNPRPPVMLWTMAQTASTATRIQLPRRSGYQGPINKCMREYGQNNRIF